MNEFIERYKKLGQDFEPAEVKVMQTLRINTLKIVEKELIEKLKDRAKLIKISFLKNGYSYDSEVPMGATPEYLQGYYYLQEAASQLPAELLELKDTDLVLDMCACPGSKTTQLAQLTNNKARIIALDANNPRLPSLKNNLERCGAKNVLVYKKDARFAEDLNLKFDKILLDAPCSGNFAVDSNWFEERKLEDFELMAKTQKQLLETAVEILTQGGILVYSTCSLEPEENELVINWLLEQRDDIILEKIDVDIGDSGLTNVFGKELNPEIAKCKRLWPHKTGTQGFFIAKIRKKS
ncbi:MAG: RsmB/NOP family class I SAM-dependent RNA methyltransferase [Nanoarchaeota archaeon]|nr:RsmB/NOP family class I SAM-dependent RNA methyltransferase [Nanoarchaeota archaeon]MBU1321435.1 RsmB/NOP family class I SAM-dependent RNA methyltransferase [Nanoarchaeota archaeon]MBU1597061.1 RsmB/NOP family class I SAM-dependent RNA methyltransferase [Nanoarchaeota archaeon]MBU2440851.1 RsmB/NOP family class I SAM-dependent RNA methyltransferase [Nanoarchaeota archaeon]